MDNLNPQPSTPTAGYITLASALGVSGPLRLLPQGPALKPHIVLKRDYPKNAEAGASSAGTVRFSFIAGKKINVSKGQSLLFSIASPDDPDGKALLSDVHAFLLEASIEDATQKSKKKPASRSVSKTLKAKKRTNVASLPPRIRKYAARNGAYAGRSEFFSNERFWSRSSFYAPEPTPRAYCSAEVQTDPIPVAKSQDITSPRRTPRPIPQQIIESPTQLPSPVSADHAREVIPDALVSDGDDGDDYARSDRSRSLSPMELSSESCSPANSLMPLPATLPRGADAGLLLESLLMKNPAPHIPEPLDEPKDALASPTLISIPVPDTAAPSLPQVLPPLVPTGDSSSQGAGAQTEKFSNDSNATVPLAVVESVQEIPADKALEAVKCTPDIKDVAPTAALPIPASLVRVQGAEGTPSAPGAETLHQRVVSQSTEARVEDTPKEQSQKSPSTRPTSGANTTSRGLFSAPAFVKSAQASIKGTWDAPTSAPYIPTPTVGNPLGIRPSSSLPLFSKPLPTGPRSLAAAQTHKKPVVVGAKWSAARSLGPSVSSTSNNSVSASSSGLSLSSSLTSIPTSPIPSPDPAPPVTKPDLSQILRYVSPSPPPPPESPPPPPPPPASPPPSLPPPPPVDAPSLGPSPPQSEIKWKRVDGSDKPLPTKLHLIGPAPERADAECNPLKRAHDSEADNASLQSVDSNLEEERPVKKCKTESSVEPSSLPPLVIRVKPLSHLISPSTSTGILSPEASSSISSVSHKPARHSLPGQPASAFAKVTIPIPKGNAPLTHPLPPKPVVASTGSSYRPSAKREQKIDTKRVSSLPTDWPSTSPHTEYRLFGSVTEPSVQKIVFNSTGTQVAVVCADRTLRIVENQPSVNEIARLTYKTQIASVCWLEGFPSVLTLCVDGLLSSWTQSGKEWKYTRLLSVPDTRSSDMPCCMAYAKDRIAVSMSSVVKVWSYAFGAWQPQREIARSGVTALKFVQDGKALIGGCRDGALWYCEVPNGTVRMHAFLSQKPIISIDVHPTGTYLLVAQEGGVANLVTMKPNENKGNIERTYTSEKIQSMTQKGFAGVFATKGQAVLYGTVNGCALVWDRKKGTIVYGLKHPEGDPVLAAAAFDGRPGVENSSWIITGTKQGRLFWWPGPVAASPGQTASSGGTPDASERKRQKEA